MNKIEFDRVGVDGEAYTRDQVEKHFCDSFEKKIEGRLGQISASGYAKTMVGIIQNKLHDLMLASPYQLEYWRSLVDRYRYLLSVKVTFKKEKMPLKNALLKAFHYDNYRKRNGMKVLAKMLNVKSCPYCNMHYTLYAESKKGKDRFAKFQFDHFVDKNTYPMFSMSLYNLIPSCGVCNNSKENKTLSLSYHPYCADIHRNFYFEVQNEMDLLYGTSKVDSFEINLVPTGDKIEFQEYESAFHLEALYSRHKDVVREVYDKVYLAAYYGYQPYFRFIPSKDYDYLKRLWLGTYTDEKDIEKRPMTKLILDVEQQAWEGLVDD